MANLGSTIVYGILKVTKELWIGGVKQPKITTSSSPPPSPQTNDIWIDTT